MDFLKKLFTEQNRKTPSRLQDLEQIQPGSTIRFEVKVEDEETAIKIREIISLFKKERDGANNQHPFEDFTSGGHVKNTNRPAAKNYERHRSILKEKSDLYKTVEDIREKVENKYKIALENIQKQTVHENDSEICDHIYEEIDEHPCRKPAEKNKNTDPTYQMIVFPQDTKTRELSTILQKRTKQNGRIKKVTNAMSSMLDFAKLQQHKRKEPTFASTMLYKKNNKEVDCQEKRQLEEMKFGIVIDNADVCERYNFILHDDESGRFRTIRAASEETFIDQNAEYFLSKCANTIFIRTLQKIVLQKIPTGCKNKVTSTPELRDLETAFDEDTSEVASGLGTWPRRRGLQCKPEPNIEDIILSYKKIDAIWFAAKRRELRKQLVAVEKVGRIRIAPSSLPPRKRRKQYDFTYVLHYVLKKDMDVEEEVEIMV